MIISIINHSRGAISDEELQHVIRAINRQIQEDFQPYWSMGATLRLEGRSRRKPNVNNIVDMRGDAIIYIQNQPNEVEGALGYHDLNYRGIPYGFVFKELADELGESWSVTLSHEALELLADPEVNLLVAGPHPEDDREVFHWYEMCDAVQDEHYKIDDVEVSNFVLPLYFTGGEESGGRNDFLGNTSLLSFGTNPGGYIGFYDPDNGGHQTYSLQDDRRAQQRMEIKNKAARTRRSSRYKRNHAKKSQHVSD